MSNLEKIFKDINHLNPKERAFIAHCLIISLESIQENAVDQAWAKLAQKRLEDLEDNKVKYSSWSEIKKLVQN
jgi:putative addiction module component (TIGR02574 family)